jgi:hypothetical protein
MRKNICLPQILAIFLVFFSSLVFGADNETKLNSIGKLLNGRSYVRMDKDLTCKSNDPEHTVLKTWANKITIENGRILIWGKVCNDSPESISFSEAGKNLFISVDLKRIIYKKEVLLYSRDTPKLCDAGQWCPVEETKP